MNTSAFVACCPRRQRGAASVAIAMLILFILAAAVTAAMNMSGSSVVDAAGNEEQISALFLAESGVERAQSVISAAAQAGSLTNTTCTNLTSLSAMSLGRGSFQYTAAAATDSSGNSTCGGASSDCTSCTFSVKGTIGSSSRTIRTQLSVSSTQGIEGNASSFTLNLTTAANNAGVVTNLAYKAKQGGGSSAHVGSCTNSAGSCSITNNGWDLQLTGTNAVGGMGVFATVPTAGTYTISDTLVDNTNTAVARNYVQTGALFYPLSGSISYVGSYGSGTGSNKTAQSSGTSGSLPSNWNCASASGTDTAQHAAGADTLVYGFSSYPSVSGAGVQVNAVTVGGIQPLRKILSMTGTQGDNLYSQIWYAYNPSYYPDTGATATATNGANFVGTIGAPVTGHKNSGNGRFVLDANVSGGVLTVGDTIKDSAGATSYGTLGTLASGTANQNNAQYNYTDTSGTTPTTSTSLRAYSTTLRLAAAPCSGTLTLSDTITGTDDVTTYGSLSATSSGTINTAGSTYTLSGGSATYITTSSTTCGGASGNVNLHSVGKTITLTGATGTSSTPSVGTAIAVSSGTGQFDSTSVTGTIGDSTGTTSGTILCSSASLNVGDALFGTNVQPNTYITGTGSGTCSGATPNQYTVNNSQAASSGTIRARAAIASVTSSSSFTVSRKPTTRFSSAKICGGVCAFLFDNSGSNTNYSLSNISSGDDYASGFVCLSGVDPTKIKILGSFTSKRSAWAEPVQ